MILTAPLLSRTRVTVEGEGTARVELSDRSPVEMTYHGDERRYSWKANTPGLRLVVYVRVGTRPLDVVTGNSERAR